MCVKSLQLLKFFILGLNFTFTKSENMTDIKEIKLGPTHKILLEIIPKAFNPYDRKLCGIWIKAYDDKYYIHALDKEGLKKLIDNLTLIAQRWIVTSEAENERAEIEVNKFLTGKGISPVEIKELDDFVLIDGIAVKIPEEEEETDN